MKWVESKQQNSTSLPKAAFPAGRPPWAFPPEVSAGRSRWVLRWFKPGPPVRGSPVLRALWVGGSGRPAPAQSRAGERCGTAYPSGGPGSYEASGRSAPLPRLPGGGPHFSREMGRKRAGGGAPWTPSFMARLLPLAHFGGRAALSRSWGYFSAHLRTLIWRLSFIKCFFSIFFTRKCVPNRS